MLTSGLRLTVLLALAAAGSPAAADALSDRPAPRGAFEVSTKSGLDLRAEAARLDIRVPSGEPVWAEVWIGATDDKGRNWTAYARMGADALVSGKITLRLGTEAPAGDRGIVEFSDVEGTALVAEGGEIDMLLGSRHRLAGEVRTGDERLAASFAGPVEATCAVAEGAGPTGAEQVLAVRGMGASPICAAVERLLAP